MSEILLGREQALEAVTSRTTPAEPGEHYLNRELSWVDFNARVLALAQDPSLPVLERAKFMAIFSQNLDEFFQVRVAGLMEQVRAGVTAVSPDGLSPIQQVAAIRSRVTDLTRRQSAAFAGQLAADLEAAGIHFCDWTGLSETDREFVDRIFEEKIFPVLTPLAVDPGHPFPYISNLSLNLAVVVKDPERTEPRIARVKDTSAPASLRGPARWRAVRPDRAGHRQPPSGPVPRNGDHRSLSVPGHPQCRLRRGRRRGRGSPGGGRGDHPAAPAFRTRGPAGDRRSGVRTGPRSPNP